MRTIHCFSLLTASVLMLMVVSVARADEVAERGLEIFTERDRLDRGYVNQTVDMEMVLRSQNGREARREISMRQLEGEPGEGDKVVIVFQYPPDLYGTALLTHEALGIEDDAQWLFLPAYKRVKRIAAKDRSGRFVGTDFSYEDLLGDKLEDFSYRYLGEDTINGETFFRVDRIPLYSNSEYSRQETWVDPQNHQVVRALLYDQKDRHIKTFEATNWVRYKDRFWRAHEITMRHEPSGRSTQLIVSDYEFNTDLSARDFTSNALRRQY